MDERKNKQTQDVTDPKTGIKTHYRPQNKSHPIQDYTPRPVLTDEQRRVNGKFASWRYRERVKAKGYRAIQFWLPDALRGTVRDMVKEVLEAYENGEG